MALHRNFYYRNVFFHAIEAYDKLIKLNDENCLDNQFYIFKHVKSISTCLRIQN